MTHLSSPPSPFEARTWKETLQLLRDAWPIRIWKHDAFLTGHTPPEWPDFEGGHSCYDAEPDHRVSNPTGGWAPGM